MLVKLGAPKLADFKDPIGVLTSCHRRIEHFVGILENLVASDVPIPLDAERRKALESSLNYFRNSAPKHVADEDESLFPRLKKAGVSARLKLLATQHEEITQLHTDLESLGLQWLSLPRLSPVTWEKLKDTVDGMSSIYSEHIQIEEHEIFPKAAEFLSPEELATVGDEMSARRKD